MLRIPPQARKDSPLLFSSCLCVLLVLFSQVPTTAQTPSEAAAQRRQALDLYERNKFADAIPILEKLVVDHPDDSVLLERLGWATFVVSGSIKNPEVRKQARDKALGYLKRAQALGDDSELLKTGLNALSQPDTTDAKLSSVPAADAALREGEEAHSRGDLDGAINGYKRALELDPKNYLAALFTGDMYFKKAYLATDESVKRQMTASAGEWFAKAIKIDPNIETAHRYWGDALMAVGDDEGAKEKFIEGIIAEPYNRTPYAGLSNGPKNSKSQWLIR